MNEEQEAAHQFEDDFLRHNAGRHIVVLRFRLKNSATVQTGHATCFVVQLVGIWWLITAGHVITDIAASVNSGFELKRVELYDSFSSASVVDKTPLPITFEASDWIAVRDDKQGIDFAAWRIPDLFRANLAVAGISAIEPETVAEFEFSEDSQIVLVGAPSESFKTAGSQVQVKLMLIPVTRYDGTSIEDAGRSVLAKLPTQSAGDRYRIVDFAGMSGCPVFRVTTAARVEKRYWLVGIQSGWYAKQRVIRFCPVRVYLELLERRIQQRRHELGPFRN